LLFVVTLLLLLTLLRYPFICSHNVCYLCRYVTFPLLLICYRTFATRYAVTLRLFPFTFERLTRYVVVCYVDVPRLYGCYTRCSHVIATLLFCTTFTVAVVDLRSAFPFVTFAGWLRLLRGPRDLRWVTLLIVFTPFALL